MLKTMMLLSTLAALAGCAGTPPPVERSASPEAAIRAAREVGAERVPRASLFLKLSEEKVAKAKTQRTEGDKARSDLTLQQAQADADLALALTRQNTAEAEAAAARAELDALRGAK